MGLGERSERGWESGVESAHVMHHALPVLRHEFKGDHCPGSPDPANAQGVIEVIARAVDRHQVYELYAAGCRDIIRDTFDSAVRAGRSAYEPVVDAPRFAHLPNHRGLGSVRLRG